MTLRELFQQHGLLEHLPSFEQQCVSIDGLAEITEQQLIDTFGVVAIGDRKRFRNLVMVVRAEAESGAQAPPLVATMSGDTPVESWTRGGAVSGGATRVEGARSISGVGVAGAPGKDGPGVFPLQRVSETILGVVGAGGVESVLPSSTAPVLVQTPVLSEASSDHDDLPPHPRRRGVGKVVLSLFVCAGLAGGGSWIVTRPDTSVRAESYAPGLNSVVGASGYALQFVPAGTYVVGCTEGQGDDCSDDEKPSREVTLTRAVLVGETEVTQDLYHRLMGSNPANFTVCGGTCPVENVSWMDVVQLANTLSAAEGFEACYDIRDESVTWPNGNACLGYRLPTEAEWEVAARGGGDEKYAGGDILGAVGWYIDNSGGTTHPVGQKASNAYGLYDMSGNVWEWVWDWYDKRAYLDGAATDPSGPASGAFRVFRGGSWHFVPRLGRVATRSSFTPGPRYSIVGVRLLRTAD